VALAIEAGEDASALELDRSLLDAALLDLARDAAARLPRGARLGFAVRPAEGGVVFEAAGLPPAPPSAGMRALAEAAGGTFAEEAEPDGAVRLRATLPAAPDGTAG
jgi:hypothetical protein